MIDRIYVELHDIVAYQIYKLWVLRFQRQTFFSCISISLWQIMMPMERGFYGHGTQGAWLEEYYSLLHTQYNNICSGLCGFGGLSCFPIERLWEIYVAMETRVLIPPGSKPDATFPSLQ